jgi:hypothetical protein
VTTPNSCLRRLRASVGPLCCLKGFIREPYLHALIAQALPVPHWHFSRLRPFLFKPSRRPCQVILPEALRLPELLKGFAENLTLMDPAEAFRQGLGSVNRARQVRTPRMRESSHESEDPSPRIAHTLAACCRCRQV